MVGVVDVLQLEVAEMVSKVLEVRKHRTISGLYEIVYAGGGQVPGALLGAFTKPAIAATAIDKHMATKKVKATQE